MLYLSLIGCSCEEKGWHCILLQDNIHIQLITKLRVSDKALRFKVVRAEPVIFRLFPVFLLILSIYIFPRWKIVETSSKTTSICMCLEPKKSIFTKHVLILLTNSNTWPEKAWASWVLYPSTDVAQGIGHQVHSERFVTEPAAVIEI